MPAPAWENLDDFLDLDDFAHAGVVGFQAGGTRTVNGIFDDPYLDAQLGEYAMDSSDPRFTAKESDLVGVRRGDTLVVAGVTYDILTGPQPDGTGMAMLKLAKQ